MSTRIPQLQLISINKLNCRHLLSELTAMHTQLVKLVSMDVKHGKTRFYYASKSVCVVFSPLNKFE